MSTNENIEEVMSTMEAEVDITECQNIKSQPALPDCFGDPDATEHSSSFDDALPGFEDGLKYESSETESNGASSFCAGGSKLFKKRRVSEHWRKYIKPLLWRCKWIELRVRELDYQASKYDNVLAVYNKEKQLQLELTSSDKSAAREKSLTCRRRPKAMRRRKRKRIEETCDIPSYTSNHTIFSYYDKKPELERYVDDGHVLQDNLTQDDLSVNVDWPMPNIGDFEKSLEQLLLGIDSLQSRIFDLSAQLNTTICNNATEIFSNSVASAPGDPHSSPGFSPGCSPVNNGDEMPFEPVIVSPYASECEDEEDMIMPGNTVSSYGDAAHPDIIESTVDLLSSAISCGGHQIANLGRNDLDDLLISNQSAAEELHEFEKASRPARASKTINEEEDEDENSTRKVSSSETETDIEVVERISLPRRTSKNNEGHLRRSKRKRKARKASPGGWNGEKKRRRRNFKKQER